MKNGTNIMNINTLKGQQRRTPFNFEASNLKQLVYKPSPLGFSVENQAFSPALTNSKSKKLNIYKFRDTKVIIPSVQENSSNFEEDSEDSYSEDQDHEEDQDELSDFITENMSYSLSPSKTIQLNVNHKN